MLSTDILTQTYFALANGSKLEAVLVEIKRLWETSSYQAWRTDRRIDSTLFAVDCDCKHLTDLGLVQDRCLQIRINKIGERYFLTDAPCLKSRFAVFPYPDEADDLLQHAYAEKLHLWADTIIDMTAGCGHTPLGMETAAKRYAYDINPRALAYARINTLLNRLPESHVSIASNDLKRALPPSLLSLTGQKILFLFNTPFNPNPVPSSMEAMPISGDGGVTGDDFQIRSFEIVADFKARCPGKEVKALFLSWTFGRSSDSSWDMQDKCEQILGARTTWTLCGPDLHDHSWSGDVQENFDQLQESNYLLKRDPAILAAFAQLTKAQAAKGFDRIGYGIVSYRG